MLSNPVSQEPVIWFFMIIVVVLWSIEIWQHGIRQPNEQEDEVGGRHVNINSKGADGRGHEEKDTE